MRRKRKERKSRSEPGASGEVLANSAARGDQMASYFRRRELAFANPIVRGAQRLRAAEKFDNKIMDLLATQQNIIFLKLGQNG
jgi:hypothetical protein